MAIQHTDAELRRVPAGVFSTADLLMESRLVDDRTGARNLTVNLNHAATRIEHADGRANERPAGIPLFQCQIENVVESQREVSHAHSCRHRP